MPAEAEAGQRQRAPQQWCVLMHSCCMAACQTLPLACPVPPAEATRMSGPLPSRPTASSTRRVDQGAAPHVALDHDRLAGPDP